MYKSKLLGTMPVLLSGFIHITPDDLSQFEFQQNYSQTKVLAAVDVNEKDKLPTLKESEQITLEANLAKSPITEPQPHWILKAGNSIGQELKNWGTQSGWNVIWNLPRDVIVPSTTEFVGEFKTAATNVIETLATNGVLINAKFYEGNKTLVINGPGVIQQD